MNELRNWVAGEIDRLNKSQSYTDAEYFRREGAIYALEDVLDKITEEETSTR